MSHVGQSLRKVCVSDAEVQEYRRCSSLWFSSARNQFGKPVVDTIAIVDVFLGSSGLLNGKSPSSHTHICHCSSISPSLKAQREPRRPSVQRFTSKQTNPGRERAPRRGDKTENMFGSRPSSNGSASSSTSSTASSSSSSSSGSSPMAFHDKQHYVCILCNK